MHIKYGLLSLIFLYSCFTHGQIFKYQDKHGKWHFSDKKPVHLSSTTKPIDTLVTQQKHTKPPVQKKPNLDTRHANGKLIYTAHNPLLAPIQYFLRDAETNKKITTKQLPPLSSEALFTQKNNALKRKLSAYYIVGDPDAKPSTLPILPPFTDYKPMKVSQGFNGRFSHNRPSNRYAVDIGMPVGTKITAVKPGLVINTKDDYAYSGVSSPFFFDKANLVEILHEDGSYAVYAHLLLGGVKVKVGDTVSAGQVIALSGNTGYSTGPHLHFVIRYNAKGKTRSVPFTFLQTNKDAQTPKRGMWLLPSTP